MNQEERYFKVIEYFKQNQPDAKTELVYNNPFELLVAVILSAQCTDKRVNIITPVLLKKYPNPLKMSKAKFSDVFNIIKSCSYPNSKTSYLLDMSAILVENYEGNVPSDINELLKIPGVGRKTANVILSVAFNKPAMAVDTHVFRVSERIGLTINSKKPESTENELVKHIPENLLNIAHHWLILHGRHVCVARKPKCNECGIKHLCLYFSKM